MQSVGLVIAATGLAAEARIAERSEGVIAVAAGGDATRLASLIERRVADGARGIISFGIAGGLRADLKSGTCVVGTSVVRGGHSYSADAAWTKRIAGCLPDAELGAIAGCQSVVADPAAKKVLFDETGAIAADMESHVVARIAADRQAAVRNLTRDRRSCASTATACRHPRPEAGRFARHHCRHQVIGLRAQPAAGFDPRGYSGSPCNDRIIPLPQASWPGPRLH